MLYCDLYFVCSIPFLLSVDTKHSYVTSSCLKDRSAAEILDALSDVKNFYLTKRGNNNSGGV